MKILILTNYANGLYLFRKELLTALQEDGHTITVSLPPDENCKKLEQLGVDIVETPFERRGNNPVKDMGLFLAYLKLIKEHKPDMVFTYTIKPNLYGGLACRFLRIPYLCNITGLGTAIENESLLSHILLKFYKISMKSAQRVFFQNKKNRDFMNRYGIACHNHKMLPGSGVNLTEHPFEEYSSEEDGIHFLAVIRIMKDKGIEEYLEAARLIKSKYPKTCFWLVGEYEEETREKYEPKIQELVDAKVITYLGHIDYVDKVMAKCHVIVHPSYHEGLSNVLLEAAACGRPVLASDINGCIETFSPGESGIAFEPRRVEALVEAIEKILALTPQERRQMGIAARAWVETYFDRRLVIDAYREEIEQRKKENR